MIPYFLVFIIVGFIAGHSSSIRNYRISSILLVICVLILSAFAGIRDDTVGTDMHVYIIYVWNHISEITNFYTMLSDEVWGGEIGYRTLNYCVSRFTNDIHWFLFFAQFLSVSIIAYISFLERSSIKTGFVMMVYMLHLYTSSFNITRQSIAICFFVLAYYLFIYKKKKIFPVILYFIALSFHNSIVLAILLPIVYYLFSKYGNNEMKLYIGVIVITIMLYYAFKTVLVEIVNSGLLADKYSAYTEQEGFRSHKASVALCFYLFLMIRYIRVKGWGTGFYVKFCQASMFIAGCLNLLGDQTEVASRVAVYFTLPLLFLSHSVTEKKQHNVYWQTCVPLFIVWVYIAISSGFSECVPYTSKILDSLFW